MERHFIAIEPGLMAGLPVVDRHRITAEQMANAWWSGLTIKGIEENWPAMNRGAVLVACWYQARYGSRTWRKRWKEWLEIANDELWSGLYSTCPMPPQRREFPDAAK